MDVREMKYFLTIAEEGSLVRAAEKLYVSQPSLSKFLTHLEASYGTQLFLRHNNVLALTEAGRIYKEAAQEILRIDKTVSNRIDDLCEKAEQSIAIGVTGERSQRFVGRLLLLLYETYPKLRVHVVEMPAYELARKLKSNDLDLAIYAVTNEDGQLNQIEICKEEVVLAVPERHRLASIGKEAPYDDLARIDLHDLASDSFVLLKKSTAMRQVADAYFKRESFHPNEVIETKGTYSSMVFVDTGLAVGFCPSRYKYHSNQIRYLGLRSPFYYTIALCYRKDAYLTKPMKKLIALAKQESSEL